MLSRTSRILLAAFVAQVAVVSTAKADRNSAVLTGIVKNASGEPIEGALVIAQSTALQGEESVLTDSRGLYRLPSLPSGVYTIQIVAQNYVQSVRKGVELRANARIRLDAKLQLASEADQSRVVEVPAPVIDVGSTATGQSIDAEFVRRVPIVNPTGLGGANRSFEAVAEATPGANNDRYGTSIAGTTSPENSYTIDGASVGSSSYGTNGAPLSSEFVKEVTVAVGGYMPEYGRATGGSINAVTKSGSNEFHGSIWANYTPGQLEGKRTDIITEGSTVVGDTNLGWIGDIGFDLGGPIVKDKVWFYIGFDAARTTYHRDRYYSRRVIDPDTGEILTDESGDELRETIPGSREERLAEMTQIQAFAKFDFKIGENHRLAVSGMYAPTLSGGDGDYSIDPQTGLPEAFTVGTYEALANERNSISGLVNARWTASSKNKQWNFDTFVGYSILNDQTRASDGSKVGDDGGLAGLSSVRWRPNPQHSILEFEEVSDSIRDACINVPYTDANGEYAEAVPCSTQTYFGGGPGFLSEDINHRVSAKHATTFFGEGLGHHEAKIGLTYEYLNYDARRGFSGGRVLSEFANGGGFYDFRGYQYMETPEQRVLLPFLDYQTDTHVIGFFLQDSWSIMDKVTLNAGLRYDAQLVYAADDQLSIALPNAVSPRVGLIWDPTQDGRSKLFASWGRFYQTVPLDIANRASSGEPGVQALYLADACDPRSGAGQRSDGCFVPEIPINADYAANPLYFPLGAAKTPVDPDLKPQSQDELIIGGEYEVFPDARVGVTYTKRWLNRVVEDLSRDEATTYFVTNPGEGSASDFPKGKRDYDQIIFLFDKRFSDNWLMTASYTLSWLRGNVAGLFRPETGQLDPFINADFDLISLLDNRDGYLAGDVRHAFKVFSAGEVPITRDHHLTIGGAFRASSGGPTNYYGAHDLYGTDEVFILPRGTGERLPWIFRVDTNLGYRYQINEDLDIALTVSVFNLFNFQSVTLRDETYTFDTVLPIADGSEEDLAGLTSLDADGNPVPAVVNPNFGNPTAYQTPRRVQFGVRFTF